MNAAIRTLPRRWEYAVVLLVIACSGNPAFARGQHEPALVVAAVLMTALLSWRRLPIFTPGALLVFLGFMGILLLQSLAFNFLPAVTIVGFLVRLYVAYAGIRLVGDFPRLYVNAMFGLAAMSLVFYAGDNLLGAAGVSLRGLLPPIGRLWDAERPFHVLLHNFAFSEGGLPYRNAGMFWEPTAFAGYLVLALILLALARGRFTAIAYRWRLALLTVCVLTTMSTTGYVVLPLALALHVRVGPLRGPLARRRLVAAYLLVLAMVAGGWLIWQRPFVGNKIRQQYSSAAAGESGSEINRFGTLRFDMEYISARPLLGWGLHASTRYMLHPGTQVGMVQGNGMTDFAARFGLLGFALFLGCAWGGLAGVAGRRGVRAVLALAGVVLLLNGETFLNHPLFLGLMFLPAPSRRPGRVRAMAARHPRPLDEALAGEGEVGM